MNSERPRNVHPNGTTTAEIIWPDEAELRLRFPPRYMELAIEPSEFENYWRQLGYAFGLPDPNHFPALTLPLKDADRNAIARYVLSCQELATYTLLGSDRIQRLSKAEGKPVSLDYTMPPKEILRGYATLFRQLHSKDEASYEVVKSILASRLKREDDAVRSPGLDYIRQWSRARAKLLQFSLMEIVQMKVLQAERPGFEVPLPENTHTPSELISMFQYGEYIHWGNKREEHAAILQYPVYAKLRELKFHDIQIGLSHFYFGFAKLAEAAVSDRG
ncbi:hypothetical protein [Arthrobacter cryoconiti]|uniref:Uncharacterized protein n=1 Tax=Arthrobacter cryoconiti TaxID=748907 RepID=A0ABV8QUQ8_9MICC|nr:hypothetical protein [Arthrobacter cryoconiti]MCC9069771.1 hypothetical protein [Arthrobacter cryoconiti]